MTCPHCYDTGYDASGYTCTCQPETPMPTEADKKKDDLIATVIVAIVLVTGWMVFK